MKLTPETKKTIKFWSYIVLGLAVMALCVRTIIAALSDDNDQSSPATQAQTESTWRPCVLETIEMAPPDRIEPPVSGKWQESGGLIQVVQDQTSFKDRFGSKGGPVLRTTSTVFKFSFSPDTGEGYWSSAAVNQSGKIFAGRDSSKEPWKVTRMLGEKVCEIFIFRQL